MVIPLPVIVPIRLGMPFPQINAPLAYVKNIEGQRIGEAIIDQAWLQLFISLWDRTGGAWGLSTQEAISLAAASQAEGRSAELGEGVLAAPAGESHGGRDLLAGLIEVQVVKTIEALGLDQTLKFLERESLELGDAEQTFGRTETGKYTPTLTNVANLDASTAYECQWLRVQDMVTVSGKVDVDPTAAGNVQLGISLPPFTPSNFAAEEDCAGAAAAPAIAGQSAAIRADAANNRAEMVWIAVDLTNQPMFFSFTYQMI
jgi:hypothetical protein